MSKLHRMPSKIERMQLGSAMSVLRAPIVTEKSTQLLEKGQYSFWVAPDANKFEIKVAVEKIFGVQVAGVNTLISLGKKKRFRGRMGVRPDRKRAIVTLKEGMSIDLTVGV